MTPTTRAHLQIHFCVLLWGFTAIIGKLITLPALPLVWWRMGLVVVAVALLPFVWRAARGLPLRLLGAYALVGALVALHWLTFYGAIKLSNASVAVTCMALGPVFLALVEPLLIPAKRFDWRELALGLAVVPGVVLVVGGVPARMHAGIAVGVLSTLLCALFGALNKRLAGRQEPLLVTGIELGAGALTLTLLAPVLAILWPGQAHSLLVWPSGSDFGWLLLLAIACTLLPFALSLVALKHISAYSAQLAINLEPVYAIALAALLLGEQRELDGQFYLGVAIVLAAVLVWPWWSRRRLAPPQPDQHPAA